MAKSPIEPAADREPRKSRAPRAKPLDGVNLRDVMKARAEQDRVLKARLKQIDGEISKLMTEHEQISMVLGIERPVDEVAVSNNRDEVKHEFTCADCGGHSGPNARGDCTDCGAGPFEQAR